MVKGISAVDSIYGTAKKRFVRTTKKVAEKISENQEQIIATGVLAGGAALYVNQLKKFVNSEDEAIDSVVSSEPGFFEKITDKIKEKFTIDLEHIPEGVNPADKYITDIDGNILYSDITNMPYPNPWYNPDIAMQQIEASKNAAANLLTPHVTMDSFIQKAGEHGTDAANAIAASVPFGDNSAAGDIIDSASDSSTSVLEYLKEIVDNISDFI